MLVAAEDDGRLGRDAEPRAQALELPHRDVVADVRVHEVGRPVHVHRMREVAGVVEAHVLARLDDADAGGVGEVA